MSGEGNDLFGEPIVLDSECGVKMRPDTEPELLALVRIAAGVARILRPTEDSAGVASEVDAARLFGGSFANSERRTIGAAAGLRHDVFLPARSLPDSAAVREAERLWAKHYLSRLDRVRKLLTDLAEVRE